MEQEEIIFNLINSMDNFTNTLLVEWNHMFNENLGISHVLILKHLKVNGRSHPSDIAKSIGLKPPTITHLCNKLLKKKCIERVTDDKDRRSIFVKITNIGEETLLRANIEGRKLRTRIFEKLTKEEQQQMLNIFKKLNE